MAKHRFNGVLQHLRKLAAVQTNLKSPDRELLERFVGARDEAAFTVLIERHGPIGNERKKSAICERLRSARRMLALWVCFYRLLSLAFLKPFPSLSGSCTEV